jgi:hypothetical protein
MTEPRKSIEGGMTVMEVMELMSEGNPGAIRVMAEMIKEDKDKGVLLWLLLDDMNIRGTQIWVGFKYHCLEDIEAFVKCVKDRDGAMVNTINVHGRRGNHDHFAVQSGASYEGKRKLISEETGI